MLFRSAPSNTRVHTHYSPAPEQCGVDPSPAPCERRLRLPPSAGDKMAAGNTRGQSAPDYSSHAHLRGYSHRERCSRTRYRSCRRSRRTLTCSSSPASTGVASAGLSGMAEVEAFKTKTSPARASSPVVLAVCSIMGAEVCSISRGEKAAAPVRSL